MKIRNLQSLLVCPIILGKSSLTRVEWVSGSRSWLASRIQSCVWCLAFHSLHAVMYVLTHWKAKHSSLADKVLKKTPLDLQTTFPKNHACPKYLAAYLCGSAFPQNGLAFRQDFEKVGKRRLTRNVEQSTAYRFSIFNISRIIHTINFIL